MHRPYPSKRVHRCKPYAGFYMGFPTYMELWEFQLIPNFWVSKEIQNVYPYTRVVYGLL